MLSNYGKPLRQWLKTKRIEEIIDFGDLPVFRNAITYPCILRISNKPPIEIMEVTQVKSLKFSSLAEYVKKRSFPVKISTLNDNGWSLNDDSTQALLLKIKRKGISLGEYVNGNIFWGIKTGFNKAFVIDKRTRDRIIARNERCTDLVKPFLQGRDIKRYEPIEANHFVILIPKGWTDIHSQNAHNKWKWFEENYPLIAEYLKPFAQDAEKRTDKGNYWWELRTCEYYDAFKKTKIIYPEICQKPEFTIDHLYQYSNNKTFIIPVNDLYLLGILNSKLTHFLFEKLLPKLQQGFFMPATIVIREFPIRTIDLSNSIDRALYEKMIGLVENIMNFHIREREAKIEADKILIRRQIEDTDRRIDSLVYELYGLTDEEIKIVESAVGK
jgi:hypothetical protein